MLPRAVSRCHGNRGRRWAPRCPPMSSRPSGMSVTHSLELHLVTPNFHCNNRCGVILWVVQWRRENKELLSTRGTFNFTEVNKNDQAFSVYLLQCGWIKGLKPEIKRISLSQWPPALRPDLHLSYQYNLFGSNLLNLWAWSRTGFSFWPHNL